MKRSTAALWANPSAKAQCWCTSSSLAAALQPFPSPAMGEDELLLGVFSLQICTRMFVSHASGLRPVLCKVRDILVSQTPEITQSCNCS